MPRSGGVITGRSPEERALAKRVTTKPVARIQENRHVSRDDSHQRPGECHGKLDAKSHTTAAAIRSGFTRLGAGSAEYLACRSRERVLDGCERNGRRSLWNPVPRFRTPGAATATAAAAAHPAALLATRAGSRSAIHLVRLRIPRALKLELSGRGE